MAVKYEIEFLVFPFLATKLLSSFNKNCAQTKIFRKVGNFFAPKCD